MYMRFREAVAVVISRSLGVFCRLLQLDNESGVLRTRQPPVEHFMHPGQIALDQRSRI